MMIMKMMMMTTMIIIKKMREVFVSAVDVDSSLLSIQSLMVSN